MVITRTAILGKSSDIPKARGLCIVVGEKFRVDEARSFECALEGASIDRAHLWDEFFQLDSSRRICKSDSVEFTRLPRRNAR